MPKISNEEINNGIYNGNEVNNIILNGVEVWSGVKPFFLVENNIIDANYTQYKQMTIYTYGDYFGYFYNDIYLSNYGNSAHFDYSDDETYWGMDGIRYETKSGFSVDTSKYNYCKVVIKVGIYTSGYGSLSGVGLDYGDGLYVSVGNKSQWKTLKYLEGGRNGSKYHSLEFIFDISNQATVSNISMGLSAYGSSNGILFSDVDVSLQVMEIQFYK